MNHYIQQETARLYANIPINPNPTCLRSRRLSLGSTSEFTNENVFIGSAHYFSRPFGACSFLSDVSHATGDFSHGLGDVFENQVSRKKEEALPNDFKGK
jgi:hypothetical protein